MAPPSGDPLDERLVKRDNIFRNLENKLCIQYYFCQIKITNVDLEIKFIDSFFLFLNKFEIISLNFVLIG